MRKLDHSNICKLYEMFEDDQIVYVVLELCGRALFDRLEEDIVLEEAEAARFVGNLASALAHIHSKNIVYRDLKPENLLLSVEDNESPTVKLVNFGQAASCGPSELLQDPVGTLHYCAPEVLRSKYSQQADIWSLGVVTFLMIYAAYPFDGEHSKDVVQAILSPHAKPDWGDSAYALSSNAKDFLKKVLEKIPKKRLTAEQALEHSWLGRHGGSMVESDPVARVSSLDQRSLEQRLSKTGQLPKSTSYSSTADRKSGVSISSGTGPPIRVPSKNSTQSGLAGAPKAYTSQRPSILVTPGLIQESLNLSSLAQVHEYMKSNSIRSSMSSIASSDEEEDQVHVVALSTTESKRQSSVEFVQS
jgi:serine/threonine protein kinase